MRMSIENQLYPVTLRSNDPPFITRDLPVSHKTRRAQTVLRRLDNIDTHERTQHHSYADVYYHLLERPLNETMIRAANQEVSSRLRTISALIAARLTKGQTSPEGPNTLIQDYTYSRFQSPLLKQISASFSANTHPNQICPEELPSLIQDLMM